MKAMEAPEKIYLRHNHKGDIGAGWLIFPLTNNDIEYTRTDAFIEKACEWLSDNLQTIRDGKSLSKHHVETIPVLGSITQTEFLEKFKKEIKYLFD